MVQLSSGGSGGDDTGGPGTETTDTQGEAEDDTGSGRTRRLRRDARSDPINPQTEEFKARPDPGSATRTSARPASGSGGAGAASGASAGGGTGEQTGPGPADGPRTASGTAPPQRGAGGAPDDDQDEVPTGGRDDPRVTTGTPGGGSARRPPPRRRERPGGRTSDPVSRDELSPETVDVAEEQVSQQLGRSAEFGEDFVLVPTGSGSYRPRLTGSFAGELSRERAREAGVDLGARAERAEDRAELAGPGPALESGGLEVSLDTFDRGPGEAVAGRTSLDVGAIQRALGQGASSRTVLEGPGGTAVAEDGQIVGGERRQGNMLAGADRAATSGLTSLVEDIESEFGIDVPGEGPVVSDYGAERDFGHVGGEAGRRFESLLAGLQEDIFEATEAGEPGAFVESYGVEAETEFTEAERRRQRVAEGAVEGLARTPAFLVGGVALGKDALDLSAKVATDLVEVDVDKVLGTYQDLGEAGVNTAAVGASQAIENPYETGGAAVGSLVGTGLLFGGAAAIGSRTGLATRLAIQPGEELLGYGGNLALRGAGRGLRRPETGRRAAERLFPNNEPLIFSEEAALRAGRAIGQRTQRGIQRAELAAVRARERVPRVAVERRPESGPLAVDPNLRPELLGRARELTREVDTTLPSRPSAGELRSRVGGAARGADVSAEAALFNLRRGAASRARRVREAPSELATSARETAGAVREGAQRRLLSADVSAQAGLVRARQRASILTDPDLPELGNPLSGVGSRLRGTLRGADVSAEAGLFNLRRGVAARARRARDAPGEAFERLQDETLATLQGADVSAAAAVSRTREGLLRRQERLAELGFDDLEGPLSGVGSRVRGTLRGADVSAEAGLFNLRRGAIERARAARERVSSLDELTLTIGDPPVSPPVFEVDVGDISLEVEGSAVDLEPDVPDVEPLSESGDRVGGPIEFDVEQETGSGVAVERVRAESPRATESDLMSDLRRDSRPGRRLETAQQPRLDPLGLTESRAGTDLVSDVVGADVTAEVDTITDVYQDTRTETELEQLIEVETETEFELVGEQRGDLVSETETELELEVEIAREVEVDDFDLTPRRRRDEDLLGAFGGWSRLVERELLNPVTDLVGAEGSGGSDVIESGGRSRSRSTGRRGARAPNPFEGF